MRGKVAKQIRRTVRELNPEGSTAEHKRQGKILKRGYRKYAARNRH